MRSSDARRGRVKILVRMKSIPVTVLDCTPGMRHDNFGDRLISRMTCGSKRKEPSVSDGVKLKAIKRAEGGEGVLPVARKLGISRKTSA